MRDLFTTPSAVNPANHAVFRVVHNLSPECNGTHKARRDLEFLQFEIDIDIDFEERLIRVPLAPEWVSVSKSPNQWRGSQVCYPVVETANSPGRASHPGWGVVEGVVYGEDSRARGRNRG